MGLLPRNGSLPARCHGAAVEECKSRNFCMFFWWVCNIITVRIIFIVMTTIMGDVAGWFKGRLSPFLSLLHQQRSEMSRDRYQAGFEYGVKLVEGLP